MKDSLAGVTQMPECNTIPSILSVGLPPERHADRVIAEMLRELARKKASLMDRLVEVMIGSKDGNPKAQIKMASRLREAGASCVRLEPGKRGRYSLYIHTYVGWDPTKDAEIGPEDTIPEKPWICCYITLIDSKGHGRTRKEDIMLIPLLFISHHVLSRAAQRVGLRTNEHLIDTVKVIWNASARLLADKGFEEWMNPPPMGHKIQLEETSTHVFLQRHYTRHAMVAATMI
jgi:hypothetical protein